jgi:hypothetical protein
MQTDTSTRQSHSLIASDRVEGTPVRRSDGGKIGTIEREEELKRAPSFAAGEDFDWGDRSREIEIHNYYRVPPYWGAY